MAQRRSVLFEIPEDLKLGIARRRASRRGRRRIARLVLLVVAALFGALAAQAGEIVALTHPSNDQTSLVMDDLRLMYSASRRQWPDRTPVLLIVPPPGSPAMDFLVKRVLRKPSEDDVSRFYVKMVYQQKITSPPKQLSTAEAVALVRSVPGALALAERSEVAGASGVQVIPIEAR